MIEMDFDTLEDAMEFKNGEIMHMLNGDTRIDCDITEVEISVEEAEPGGGDDV